MKKIIFEIPQRWFVCPVTKEELIIGENGLESKYGIYFKDIEYGYWNFMPAGLQEINSPEWKIWEILQTNSTIPYGLYPEENLGVGKRKDFFEFADFAGFHGTILDVGVGPQKVPTHIEYCANENANFIGIDPLVGEQPREFCFIRGLAEYLPFRKGLFDQVLFITSLDHFIDARPALREAARVMNEKGQICVWLGEKDKDVPKPKESEEWYRKLKIPKGADDPFHFRRFKEKDFRKALADIGLHIHGFKKLVVDAWRRNLFFKIIK